jgi:hypothetical protein
MVGGFVCRTIKWRVSTRFSALLAVGVSEEEDARPDEDVQYGCCECEV